jgi:predicted dehydrogenase
MRTGVVGTGLIAHDVVPHLGDWDFEVTAICSTKRSHDKAVELAEPYGAQTFDDYDAFLGSGLFDVVYLAVPNSLHLDFSVRAFDAGKDVIVEKPICCNINEAERLAAHARERQRMVYEAITTIHLPDFKHVQELLPRIGRIHIVTVNYSQYSSRYDAFLAGDVKPAFDPQKAGGALMDLGVYDMAFLVGLFGEPESTTYSANIARDIDTSGIANLDYGTFKAVAICAKDCQAPTNTVVEGEKGYIQVMRPPFICGDIVLHMNDGTEEHYDDNPALRWEPEFAVFRKGLAERDFAGCYRLLETSLSICRVMTEARRSAGIRFPADA